MTELFGQFDFWSAFWTTIQLTVLGAIGALIIGTIVAILRLSPVTVLRGIGTTYVAIFRNTPLTVIIFACVYVLYVQLGISLANDKSGNFVNENNFRMGVLGLAVYHAAFVCEALRSGVNTIPVGQAEAARSIGLTFAQSMRSVVLPQAFRGAITPLGNTLIALTKNTTVVITIGVVESAYVLNEVNESATDKLNLAFAIVALFFVILTVPMGIATGRLASRWAVQR